MKENRKIEVISPVEKDELEVQQAKDFHTLISRFDEAKKPLSQRSLFRFNQKYYFIAILLIIVIMLLILGIL